MFKASLHFHHCFYLYSSSIDSPNSRQCDILVNKSERYSYLNYQLASHHIENKRKNESSLPDLSCGFKSRLPSKPLLLLLHHSPCSLPYSHTASKTLISGPHLVSALADFLRRTLLPCAFRLSSPLQSHCCYFFTFSKRTVLCSYHPVIPPSPNLSKAPPCIIFSIPSEFICFYLFTYIVWSGAPWLHKGRDLICLVYHHISSSQNSTKAE